MKNAPPVCLQLRGWVHHSVLHQAQQRHPRNRDDRQLEAGVRAAGLLVLGLYLVFCIYKRSNAKGLLVRGPCCAFANAATAFLSS